MGLRILSVGSLIADAVSVANLTINGIATETAVHGLLLIVGIVLPPAYYLAEQLLRRLERPSAEVARQLASFEKNYL